MRVRVESDEFHDDEPGPPMAVEGISVTNPNKRPPYTIVVSPISFLSFVDGGIYSLGDVFVHLSLRCSVP